MTAGAFIALANPFDRFVRCPRRRGWDISAPKGHHCQHRSSASGLAKILMAATRDLLRDQLYSYPAPTTLKSWLTKTWCGQLTPMLWTSYSPLLSFTTRSTIPPG